MTATILHKRPVIGMCVLAACAAFLAQPAAAKKAASDSSFNAAMVAGDPMSPISVPCSTGCGEKSRQRFVV
ncbi:hypothetical protein [Caballeronia cordobensis]|uniref:hypothetical protein n=1 Tax=Caballeronia cordobensis TaxID=1353886 RepID=UPI0006AD6C95|nr:hypothetical protein [Caballeronia cordobensis]